MDTHTGALASLSDEIASAVERVAPSVVAVEGRSRIGSSGFFIRPDLILTADHAIESDEIAIVRADGKEERVTIAGRDPSTDLALLRTTASGVPLEFSAAVPRVGAIALAVARDDDGDLAATMGVISAVGGAWRTWQGGELDRFVRADLSFYPRFSGSPLLDVAGRVLGLNTGGLSRRQAVVVPATTIERVVETLLSRGGRIPRGYLGVALQRVSGGAIVLGVEGASPADAAGLIVGDVITAIGGERIEDADDVHAQLGSGTVGARLRIDVLRGGAPRQLDVVVGERAE
ncbi:MAG TPA: S1C family serine protease [Candidatus Elarobacter sp.]|nr:S1C family serine protease [Candidatus Elarobacter sp.]